MRVLNVGSGGADIPILPCYDGHEVIRLDIDPVCDPDWLMDVRDVGTMADRSFDAVYCSHALEHFYLHEAEKIVKGIHHILTDDGVCDVIVPDVGALLFLGEALTFEQVIYESPAGPITVHDMLYGYSAYQHSGDHPEYQTHRSGWSAALLGGLLRAGGFNVVYAASEAWDLRVIGFKTRPDADRLLAFGVEVKG